MPTNPSNPLHALSHKDEKSDTYSSKTIFFIRTYYIFAGKQITLEHISVASLRKICHNRFIMIKKFHYLKIDYMNYLSKFLTLAAALLIGVSAQARISPGEVVGDLSALKGGDRIFVQGRWSIGNSPFTMEEAHWLSSFFPSRQADSVVVKISAVAADESCFELEDAGQTLTFNYDDGTSGEVKGFYIKSVRGGKYLTNNNDKTSDYEATLSLKDAKTTVWYITKAVTMGIDPENPEGGQTNLAPAEASVLCCLSSDSTKLYLNNNYMAEEVFVERLSTSTDSPTWHEIDYAEPEDKSIDAAVENIIDIYNIADARYKSLRVGTYPGFCKEEYYNALGTALANSMEDSNFTTEDDANACYQNLLDAYLNIDEKGREPITNGYYWIINGQNTWNALGEGGKKVSLNVVDNLLCWSLLNENDGRHIWELKSKGNGEWDMKNLGTQRYIDQGSFSMTGEVHTTIDSTQRHSVKFVQLESSLFGIKVHDEVQSDIVQNFQYIHCVNHGNVDEAIGYPVTLWLPLAQSYSGWYLIPVSDEIVSQLTPPEELLNKEKEAKQLADSLRQLINATKNIFTKDAISVTPTVEQETANNYADLSSNAGMSVQSGYSYGNDGEGFLGLIDDDPNTYFHSTYLAQPEWSEYYADGTHPEDAYPTTKHNIGVKLTRPVNNFYYEWTERQGQFHDTPALIDVEVSNNGRDWNPIAINFTSFDPAAVPGGKLEVGPFDLGDEYQYVRFSTPGSARGPFFNLGGLKVMNCLTIEKAPAEVRSKLIEEYYTARAQVNKSTSDDIDDLKTTIANLNEAYNNLKAIFVDLNPLRTAISNGEGTLNGFTVSDKFIGAYTESADTTALSKAVADGKALIESSTYTTETVESFAKAINDNIAELNTHLVKPDPNKWYRLQFGSEAELTDLNFPDDCFPLADRVVSVTKGYDNEASAISLYDNANDVIYGNAWLQSVPVEDADFTPELSYFRFIAVGDSGYVVQNKATGLFIPDLVRGGRTSLSTRPGVFKVKYFGNKFVTLNTHSLFDGQERDDNLHFSCCTWENEWKQAYILGWNENMTSKCAFHIQEVEDVDALIGSFQATGTRGMINPETTTMVDGATAYRATGKMTDEDGNTYITYKSIKEIPAGTPALIIPTTEESSYIMSLGTDFTSSVNSDFPALACNYYPMMIPLGDAYIDKGEDGLFGWFIAKEEGIATFEASSFYLITDSIKKLPNVSEEDADLLMLVNGYKDIVNSISNVKTVGKGKHAIYTLDGVKINATPQELTKGIYIIDGKKVLVP